MLTYNSNIQYLQDKGKLASFLSHFKPPPLTPLCKNELTVKQLMRQSNTFSQHTARNTSSPQFRNETIRWRRPA